MTWFSGIVVFVIIWWVVFFAVLPVGVRAPHELGEEVGPGHADGAPVRPRLWLKAGVTTLAASVLWAAAFVVIDGDLFSFRP